MKKKIIAGVCAGVVLAASPLTLIGCSKDASLKEYQKNLASVVSAVQDSDSFSLREIKIRNVGSYNGYAPNYTSYVISKVNDTTATSINSFIEVAEEYDFISSYCINVLNYISTNITKYKDEKPTYDTQKGINELNENLNNFKSVFTQQENRINNMNKYFNALSAEDMAKFASSELYNYKKGYSNYVREILDLAQDNINLLDSYTHIEYKVDSVYTNENSVNVMLYQNALLIQNNLTVLDSYFQYLVEEFSAKTPEVFDENNQNLKTIIAQVNSVKAEYEKFIVKVAKTGASSEITQANKARIQNNYKVFRDEMKIVEKHLSDFDMYSLIYTNNADLTKISNKQNFEYEQISNYYNSTIKTWTNYYLSYFA